MVKFMLLLLSAGIKMTESVVNALTGGFMIFSVEMLESSLLQILEINFSNIFVLNRSLCKSYPVYLIIIPLKVHSKVYFQLQPSGGSSALQVTNW
jgi:hypothetical protein